MTLVSTMTAMAVVIRHLFPRPGDHSGDSIELLVGQPCAFAAEQRGDGLLARPVEERVDQMPQRRLARGLPRQHRHVDEAHAVELVAHVPFLLEDTQLRANGRVAGLARQLLHHVGGGGAPAAEQNVHDLPFATGRGGVRGDGTILAA